MSGTVLEAASRLADVLVQENAALQRMDLPAAVALVPAKEAALAEMARDTPLPANALSPAILALGRRLADLAEENRILLERAIGVQTRIVRMIARAIVPARETEHYRHPDDRTKSVRTMAVAISRSV
jgi:inactivated superfamily I helicase